MPLDGICTPHLFLSTASLSLSFCLSSEFFDFFTKKVSTLSLWTLFFGLAKAPTENVTP
jgi:hypothetical protein